MASTDVGSAADFLAGALTDFPIVVSRTPVTIQFDNTSSDRNLTEGTPANITVVFENDNVAYSLTEAGLQEGADARMFVQSTDTINKEDKITYNGVDYRVESVSVRYDGGADECYKVVLLYRL